MKNRYAAIAERIAAEQYESILRNSGIRYRMDGNTLRMTYPHSSPYSLGEIVGSLRSAGFKTFDLFRPYFHDPGDIRFRIYRTDQGEYFLTENEMTKQHESAVYRGTKEWNKTYGDTPRTSSIATSAFPQDKDGFTEISFKIKGDAVSSLVKLLHHCETCGNQGHSFGIEYDGKNGGFDGDGSDRIADLTVNGKKLPKDFDK